MHNPYHLENANLFNFQAGELKVMKILGKDRTIFNKIVLNQGRYEIILTNECNVFYMFKRDPFYTFGDRFFRPGEIGDTINTEDLQKAMNYDCKEIYSVFSDGSAYKISMKDFLCKAQVWINREGKEVASISLRDYFCLKL